MVDVDVDEYLITDGKILKQEQGYFLRHPPPKYTPHSIHSHIYVHNTPSPVVEGGGGAVVVSPITSATDGPRMKRGSMNIHNRDKGEVASTGPVSQLVTVNVELCTWSTV